MTPVQAQLYIESETRIMERHLASLTLEQRFGEDVVNRVRQLSWEDREKEASDG